MSNYVGLHQHTDNSLLDGLQKVTDLAQRAKELGHRATAITDHGDVGGHVAFQKACREKGIKPIFGMEGYLVDDIAIAREERHTSSQFSHITLLAKSNKGLRNLWQWSSDAYTENFYHKGLADWEFARKYADDLVATDGCLLSFMAMAIIEGDEGRCHELIGRYLDVFGENFYMELHTWQFMNPVTERQIELNRQMTMVNQAKVGLAQQYGIPMIVVNDAHFARPDDWEDHNIIWEMSTHSKKDSSDQTDRGQTAAWVMDDAELYYWMSRHGIPEHITAEAIKNTAIIGESCDAEIKGELRIPRLTDSDRDDLQLFLRKVEDGFKRKVEGRGLDRDVYWARVESEIRTITSKSFHGYLNVVADYTKWAKERMLVGPGRGSAGGSLVAYLMDITEVDPIPHGLLFERFISPERKNFPDIDLDFPQSRRGEVIDYIASRFGHDCVCPISTRGKLAPKSAIKAIGKAMSIPYADTEAMSKIVEQVDSMDDREEESEETWEDLIERRGGDLLPWIHRYPAFFARVERMIGTIRQAGKHPAGLLVSDRPIAGDLPLRTRLGEVATQFDMREVEELGFVKLDILGLRHLDTVQTALDLIKSRHGLDLDPYTFDEKQFNDPAIWPAVHDGGTLGLFQLETPGGTSATKKFKPWSLAEVADLVSINRPGVIDAGLDGVYIDRRHGREAVVYDHPLMQQYVGDTQGILVYQEQIFRVVQGIAGFTPDEADALRGVLSKKDAERLPPFREKFFANCLSNPEFTGPVQHPQGAAEAIWRSIEASGRYSFNKSHAVEYSIISCWEAWLKHYYYPEFITALLRTDSKKVKRYIQEARGRGMKLLPPDINESGAGFTLISDDTIRFGITNIKGVGQSAMAEISGAAPFSSLEDLIDRVSARSVHAGVLRTLIRAGALDSLGDRRELMLRLAAIKKIKDIEIPDFDDPKVLTELEEELLGTWVTYDPLAEWHQLIQDSCATPEEIARASKGDILLVGGQITAMRETKTKAGKPMAFFMIGYNENDVRVVSFPESWAANKPFLEVGAPVICRVAGLDDGIQLIATQRLDYLKN